MDESANDPRPAIDEAHFSPALFAFYGCCAMVSLGAGMFFFAFFALNDAGFGALPLALKVVGGGFMVIGLPGAFYCLARARRSRGQASNPPPG